MTTPTPHTQRHALGSELRRLRGMAGLSGQEMARRLNISQSTVSRAESGARPLSIPQVRAWARVTGTSAETRDRLLQLTEAAYSEVQSWRDAMAGVTHLQGRAAAMDAESRTIRSFWPIILPGLLQTPDYARRIFELCDLPGQDIPASVAARMERQNVLYDTAKTLDFLVTEAALRFPVGPSSVMKAQWDRVVTVGSLDNVSVGLIPIQHKATAIGWHQFTIHDDVVDGDPYVYVELAHGELLIPDPPTVEAYRRQFDQLSNAALFDADAAEFIRGLIREQE